MPGPFELAQFGSWAFTQRARASGLLPSMGSIGDCVDNAMMESFWARVQVELLNRRRWRTRVELSTALFEGLYPGQPIDPHTLGRRLKAIGVPPQLARHASLLDVASELPAVVISRLLGLHQSTGDNWTRESQGFGADYAADVSRR